MHGRRKYTIFIDESGEAGIERVRSQNTAGASPFLTLGAALMLSENFESHREKLADIKVRLNKQSLHCSELRHFQKLFFAREVAKSRNLLFLGVISKKSTLGNYAERIDNESSKFYNKCCKYLFEIIGRLLRDSEICMTEIDFVMEEGNFEYEALKRYLRVCRYNPIYGQSKMLAYIDPNNISVVPKSKEKLLCYADLVAHALYKAVDTPSSTYNINETRYLSELRSKFLRARQTDKVVGKGIKVIHKIEDLDLDEETLNFFRNL